jgi:DNA-binding CsgD family transcriptional regulator
MTHADGADSRRERQRATLERLLELDAVALQPALDQAARIVAEALEADTVDAFLYEAATDSLVARGTGDTPLGRRQRESGMDRLPLANGGRAAEAFRTGRPHRDGRVDEDAGELEGIKAGLGVRSQLLCPFDVDGERRGILAAVSARPRHFSGQDARFFGAVAGWLGLVLHRAELVQRLLRDAEERDRHEAIAKLLDRLTPRQREIAALLAGGLSNRQIAAQLVLVPGTVANHVEQILARLGLQRRTEVAVLVAEVGAYRPGADGPEPTPTRVVHGALRPGRGSGRRSANGSGAPSGVPRSRHRSGERRPPSRSAP